MSEYAIATNTHGIEYDTLAVTPVNAFFIEVPGTTATYTDAWRWIRIGEIFLE